MSVCGGLEHIFEKTLPENSTLLQSLSPWNHTKSLKPVDESSFTEIFGELHFKEKTVNLPLQSSSSSSEEEDYHKEEDSNGGSITDQEQNKSPISSSYYISSPGKQYKHTHSFSSESLSLCTEGLGLESFDDVEDSLKLDAGDKEWQHQEGRTCLSSTTMMSKRRESHWSEPRRSRTCRGAFPPPISCIGRSGKPWVFFKSYRENGKFILKEIRTPTQEFLHAFRENGRLRLQFVQSDDEVADGEEDAEEEETDNGDEYKQQEHINDQEQRV